MIRKLISAFILISLLTVSAVARPGSSWLEIGPGGRAAALGEAMTASVNGATASYWNPAKVGLSGSSIEVMYADWWVDQSSTQYLAGDFSKGKIGFAVDAIHVGIYDMELRSRPSATPIGEYDARNYAIGATLALPVISRLRAGVHVQYLSESIYVHNANGWASNFGLYYSQLFNYSLDIGFSARNLGNIDAIDEEAFKLPATYSLGMVYHISSVSSQLFKPRIMMDVVKVESYDLNLKVGAEADVYEYLSARVGYVGGIEGQGLSFGFGVNWESWRFDYGYTPLQEDLGTAQRISVSATW